MFLVVSSSFLCLLLTFKPFKCCLQWVTIFNNSYWSLQGLLLWLTESYFHIFFSRFYSFLFFLFFLSLRSLFFLFACFCKHCCHARLCFWSSMIWSNPSFIYLAISTLKFISLTSNVRRESWGGRICFERITGLAFVNYLIEEVLFHQECCWLIISGVEDSA